MVSARDTLSSAARRHRRRSQRCDEWAFRYVLGTLRRGARRRFVRLMQADARFALATARWRKYLDALAPGDSLPAPPRRVWLRVMREINNTRE